MDALVKRIYDRCEEYGDCWEWQGAFQSKNITPTIHYERRVLAVRRLIAEQQGHDMTDKIATYKCGNQLCVNPDHIQVTTRKKLAKRMASELKYHSNPVRMKKLSDSARTRGKLTIEIVRQIREAPGSQRQIAAQFGISQATVSAILRGSSWREYSNPFAQLFGAFK